MRRSRALTLVTAATVAVAGTAVWIALPASAAATTATFTKTSDWGSGWQGQYTITNGGSSPLNSWKVEFDLPTGTSIGSYWEAAHTPAGQHFTFTNPGYGGTVAPGASVSFGLIGVGPGSPANCKLNGASCAGSGTSKPDPAPSASPSAVAPSQKPPASPPPVEPDEPQPGKPQPPNPTTGAGSDKLPITLTNNAGRGKDALYLYVLGEINGKLGYVDRAGAFTPWSGGGNPPVSAPDVAIPGPAQGDKITLQVPRGLSGRIYFAYGAKLVLKLSENGLVQPSVSSPGDPNKDILFDWTELTFNTSGLWINSSQVDHFAIPHAVSVTGGSGKTIATGEIKSGGRQKVFNALKAKPGWAGTVYTRGDGVTLRALAPGKAADFGTFSATYLDPYITDTWNTYKTQTLTVVPFQLEPNKKYFGKTDGSGNVMHFTDGSGATVYSINKPKTADVWGCDGSLVAPNDAVKGPIARSLCAAMNRTTLGRVHTAPTYQANAFYQGSLTNFYSKVVHENMVDGKAYGFAFDDVANQESLVHDGDPRGAGIVLCPL